MRNGVPWLMRPNFWPEGVQKTVDRYTVFLHPDKKLLQIISVGPQGFGGIVLPLKGSEKQLTAFCGGDC
jgi:hypothetical protein